MMSCGGAGMVQQLKKRDKWRGFWFGMAAGRENERGISEVGP